MQINTNYRPHLDGIRAIAITLVLVEHLNLFKGYPFGGVGVGIFFSLSGYLITTLLYGELAATGNIQLKTFYARRLIRLMPILLLVAFVGSLVFIACRSYRSAFNAIFAVTYTTNYASIVTGHFLNGFGHTWSLAVEEHFYLLFPVLLMSLYKRGLPIRKIARVLFCIALGTVAWRVLMHAAGASNHWLYVGTLERMDALLVGCGFALLAIQGYVMDRQWLVSALLGLLVCLSPWAAGKPVWLPFILALSSAALIFGTDNHLAPKAAAWLSHPVLAHLGKISYGLYLWHGIVFTLVWERIGQNMYSRVLELLLSLALAHITFMYFERPVRDRLRNLLEQGKLAPAFLMGKLVDSVIHLVGFGRKP